MTLLVSNFEGAQLCVFLLRRPTQTAISKADDSDDDENDADDCGWFHRDELTAVGGLGSN